MQGLEIRCVCQLCQQTICHFKNAASSGAFAGTIQVGCQKTRISEKFLVNTLDFVCFYNKLYRKVKVDEIVTREIPLRDYQIALDFAFAREGIKIAIIP